MHLIFDDQGVRMRKAIIVLALSTAISVVAIAIMSGAGDDIKNPTELGAVEITRYEGQKLSSVDDFRENSIKGPQYVDIGVTSFRLVASLTNQKATLTTRLLARTKATRRS
jgi:hypothetical protein